MHDLVTSHSPTTILGPVLRPLIYEDVLFVARNMREEDQREIYATRWVNDPGGVARDCMNSSCAFGWTMGLNCPIAAIGAFPMWPGVWSVWMFATPRFNEISLGMTRFVRKKMIPTITGSEGYNRAQCNSICDHRTAHKWLESLGATRESTLKKFGKNGEDFYTYCWL